MKKGAVTNELWYKIPQLLLLRSEHKAISVSLLFPTDDE